MCRAGGRLRPNAALIPSSAAPRQPEHGRALDLSASYPPPCFGATAKAPVLVWGVSGPVSSCSSANSPPACENEVPRS